MIILDAITEAVVQRPRSAYFTGRKHFCGEYEGRIYRIVTDDESKTLYQELFDDPEWMVKLFRAGMVQTRLLGHDSNENLILEHDRFYNQTMFHEWTYNQKKDLAMMVMRIQEHLVTKDCFLSDPHAFNVTTAGSVPMYFDFGSIVRGPYPEREWLRNFWLGQTYMESWFRTLGLSYAQLQDFINHTTRGRLAAQRDNIARLVAMRRETEWSGYGGADINLDDSAAALPKKYRAVKDLLDQVPKPIMSAVDIGCNNGALTELLLRWGVERATGLDVDEPSIERLYARAKANNLPITAALSEPMALHGWHAIDWGDRKTWPKWYEPSKRFCSDLVVAVALVHHLCYHRDLSFAYVAEVLAEYSSKWLVVEWIPSTDKHLNGEVNHSGGDRRGYTEGEFLLAFGKHFTKVVATEPSTDHRKMYLMMKEEQVEQTAD